MPERQEILKQILQFKFGIGYYTKPEFINSNLSEEINKVYMSLGGVLPLYPFAYRGYDIKCKNFILELDEEQHFNRYRLITFNSIIYNKHNYFDLSAYKKYCNVYEKNCLIKASNRKYWSTSTSDKQFGKSSEIGQFKGNGSSRWRQRAFYDYLRDCNNFISNYKLIRVSIWEVINNKTIDEILNKSINNYYPDLIELIISRT